MKHTKIIVVCTNIHAYSLLLLLQTEEALKLTSVNLKSTREPSGQLHVAKRCSKTTGCDIITAF